MKNKLSLLVGLASLAAIVGVQAQTAVTDPVGYITVKIEGAGSSSLNTFSAISPTLVNKTEYSGAITAITGTTIDVSGTPFTVGQFPAGAYWVEVTSGGATKEGAWTNITANTANQITVADDMTSFAAIGSTIKIRKHVTVGQFFGATNSAGLKPGADPGLADTVTFIEPGSADFTAFYDGAKWSNGDDFGNSNELPIEPGQGLLVTHTLATDVSFVFTGYVKTGQTMIAVRPGNNVLPVPLATGLSLGTSNLANAGSPSTGLRKGADAGLAETVTIFDPAGGSANTTYFATPSGVWNDAENFENQDATVIPEGGGLYIVREGAAFNWIAPAQNISTVVP